MKDDHPTQLPVARTEQLIVKEVDDEVLVYDLTNDKAHCLNDTAAKVWKNCDGKNSVADIGTSIAKETSLPIDEAVVWLALGQLKQFKLLAEVPSAPAVFAGMSRRQMIRNLGVAGIALPVIISIAAPMAQAQSSCVPNNGTCTIGVSTCCNANKTCSTNPTGPPTCH